MATFTRALDCFGNLKLRPINKLTQPPHLSSVVTTETCLRITLASILLPIRVAFERLLSDILASTLATFLRIRKQNYPARPYPSPQTSDMWST